MSQKLKRLKSSMEEGLWIQCCNEDCKKWRFVKEFYDPLSVPEIWVCSFNLDKKFSSCDIPQEELDGNLVECKYRIGNIVWVKLKSFPWWPAIIDLCPETQTFYELHNSEVPVRYHVTFFEEGEVRRDWVKPENIKPFKDDDGDKPTKKAKKVYFNVDYTESLEKSLKIARSALALEIDVRLKKYSLLAQIKQRKGKCLLSQSVKKRSESNKRRRRRTGCVNYITANFGNKRNLEEIKSLVFKPQEEEKDLSDSSKNEQCTFRNSILKFIQISLISPQRWNSCIIQ